MNTPLPKDHHGNHMTVKEYLYRRDKLLNTPYKIKPDGSGVYIYNGVEYTAREFRRLFPLPVSLLSINKDNTDTRKDWMRA